MRPFLERLEPAPEASWSMLNRRLDDAIPFEWHHHPELELTLTLNSEGHRFIGDSVEPYEHGDLVLIGPHLPHTWASREKLDAGLPHIALVFWFRKEWLDTLIESSVELRPLASLLAKAGTGLSFGSGLGRAMAPEFEAMFAMEPAARLLALLGLLGRLAAAPGARPLSELSPRKVDGSRLRIDRVLHHLHQTYPAPLSMDDLAAIAALSVSGVHRLFMRHTGMNVSDYVTRLRIGDACARLSGGDDAIQSIASDVGYPSLANFNRQFKRLRAMTPRAYRARFHN